MSAKGRGSLDLRLDSDRMVNACDDLWFWRDFIDRLSIVFLVGKCGAEWFHQIKSN